MPRSEPKIIIITIIARDRTSTTAHAHAHAPCDADVSHFFVARAMSVVVVALESEFRASEETLSLEREFRGTIGALECERIAFERARKRERR